MQREYSKRVEKNMRVSIAFYPLNIEMTLLCWNVPKMNETLLIGRMQYCNSSRTYFVHINKFELLILHNTNTIALLHQT